MKILVKLPCRERASKLIKRIEEYQSKAIDKSIKYLISLDANDNGRLDSCNMPHVLARLKELNCIVFIGDSKNKIDACNRDIDMVNGWDILVLASDDMECVCEGWDKILKFEMEVYFPDTDGVLWHWDGDANTRGSLNTMCILGKKYFDRFNYIYHPKFISLWADNLFTELSIYLNKSYYSEDVLFKHVHYSNTRGMQQDALMRKTQTYYMVDQKMYQELRIDNFKQLLT